MSDMEMWQLLRVSLGCFVLNKIQYTKAWQKLLEVAFNQEVFNWEWKHYYTYTQEKKKIKACQNRKLN